MSLNVLITSCGRRVELTQSFAKACKQYNGIVVCADMSETAPALVFADKHYRLPAISDDKFIECIIDICKKEKIALVVPTIDTELEKFALFSEKIQTESGAKVLISNSSVVEICGDKLKTAEFFKENNLSCAYTLTEKEILKTKDFPLFIKPSLGSSSINAFKVKNRKELDFFKEYVPGPIIQQFVSGKEYTIDALCDFDSKIISVVPRLRLATRGGEILKGQIDKNRVVIDAAKKLLNVLRPIGHITIQGFLGEDNEFRFIEINARFGGGAPMSFYAGANSPVMLLKLLSGEKLVYTEDYQDKIIYSRFDSCVAVKQDD